MKGTRTPNASGESDVALLLAHEMKWRILAQTETCPRQFARVRHKIIPRRLEVDGTARPTPAARGLRVPFDVPSHRVNSRFG